MKSKKLEAVIQSLTDSLEIIAHNPVETEYVLSLIEKYKQHYHENTGRHYSTKAINKMDKVMEMYDKYQDTKSTQEWKDEMDSRFSGVD